MTRNASPRARALMAATSALVVTGALALGACGGDGSSTTDGSAAAAKAGSSSTSTTNSSTGKAGSPTKDGTATVDIEDFAFSPDGLRVKAGTKVTFTNKDGFDHTVTAKDGSFDSGHLAEQATFERTFDTPGTYAYLCSIHNSMTGSVVVS